MGTPRFFRVAGIFALSLLIPLFSPSMVLANAGGAGLGFLPFLAPLDWILGPLITVAVAILERPFFRRAGASPWALLHSLRANFLIYGIGTGLTACFWYLDVRNGWEGLHLLFLAALVASTFVIEIGYVRRVVGSPRPRWWWIVFGNVWSNLLMFLCLPLLSILDRMALPRWIKLLHGMGGLCVLSYFGIVGVAVLLTFGVPLWQLLPENWQRALGVPLPPLPDPPASPQPLTAPDSNSAPAEALAETVSSVSLRPS